MEGIIWRRGGVLMRWHNEKRKISDLIPMRNNPRRLTEKQGKDLKRSLEKFDLVEIPAINTDNTIIAGHQRLKIMALLGRGAEEIDVRVPDKQLTPGEVKEYCIRSNKNTGEFDFDVLANEFDEVELINWGFTAEELGIDGDESGSGDAEPRIDEAEKLVEKYGVKLGQIWELGEHRIMCGDSASPEVVKKIMGDLSATLLFTDPPYGVSIGKKNSLLNEHAKGGQNNDDLNTDDLNPDELKIAFTAIFKNWYNFLADDCAVFVCSPQGGGLGMMMMMMMMIDVRLEARHIINWVKNYATFSLGRLDYDYQHEPILFTWKKTHKRKKEGQFQTSLWAVDKPRSNKLHPTIKPVELPVNSILNHTDKGDIVVDMFLGSGTTLIACENTGRKFRGCDIEPKYIAVSIQRWVDLTGREPKLLEVC